MPAAMMRYAAVIAFILTGGVADGVEMHSTRVPESRVEVETPRDLATANGLLARGMYDLAAEEYAALLDGDLDEGSRPLAQYGLAICLYHLDRLPEALAVLESLEDATALPYHADALVLLGRIRLMLGDPEGALPVLERMQREHRHHDLAADAAVGQVEALSRLGRHEEVARTAERFVEQWPDHGERWRVLYYWGVAESALDRPAAAIEHLDAISPSTCSDGLLVARATLLGAECLERTSRWKEAGQRFASLVDSAEGDVGRGARLGFARVSYRGGQFDAAMAALDQVIEGAVGDTYAGSALMLRGRIRLEQERIEEARADFKGAEGIEGVAGDEIAFWLARCAAAEGDDSAAAAGLERVLAEQPDSPLAAEVSFDRARALLNAGETDAALKAFASFRDSFPDHPQAGDALLVLAFETHRAGDLDASDEHCKRFAKDYPDHPRAAEIEFLQAENAFLRSRTEQALEAFRVFVDHHPKDAQAAAARFRAGQAAYRLKRDDDAWSYLAPLAENDDVIRAFPEALRILGDIAIRRGEWKVAEAQLTRYVEHGEGISAADEGLFNLARALQQQGQSNEALRRLDQLLADHPTSTLRDDALFERGQIRLVIGEADGAAADFAAVQASEDKTLAGYAAYQLGVLAQSAGRSDEAAAYFEQAGAELADDTLRVEAEFHSGESLLAAGEYAKASDHFARFVKAHKDHPLRVEAEVNLAIALSRLDKPDDALRCYERISDEQTRALGAYVRGRMLYEKAWVQRALGRTEDAQGTYAILVADRDTDAELRARAALESAELYANANQHDAAIRLLEPLCAAGADDVSAPPADVRERAMYRLAVCRYATDDFAASAELLGRLLDAFPDSVFRIDASLYCAEALHRLGRHEAAASHFGRVIEETADEDTRAAALLRLGETLAGAGHWAESEAAFARYLKERAGDERAFQARFGLGWARENLGRYEEAIAAYREVTASHKGPTAARAQFQIGECLFAQQEHEAAVRELLKVDILYAYPEWSAAALVEAGKCFEQLNRLSDARRQFEAVIERFPETEWAVMARTRLPQLAAPALPGHETTIAQENKR